MSFLKSSTTYLALQSSLTEQPGPKTPWLLVIRVAHVAMLIAIMGVSLCSSTRANALAHAGQAAASANDVSEIDTDAIDAVKKMGAYLRTLKSFQVIDDSSQDDVLDDGLIVQ